MQYASNGSAMDLTPIIKKSFFEYKDTILNLNQIKKSPNVLNNFIFTIP